jgi:hypothetical protein
VISNRQSVCLVVATLLLAIPIGAIHPAQEQLPRVSLTDPRLKVLRVVQAQPVAGVYANTVTADVVIGVDGSVESVTVREGQKAQQASAIAALKQYRFAPVAIDGKPTRVVLRIGVHVPDTFSDEALARNSAGTTSVTVPARRDVVLLADCSRALSTQDGSEKAIRTCRDAVAAADQAGADALSRRSPRRFLGDVYMFARRWSDAVAAFESAMSIAAAPDANGLSTGELLTKIAIAQVNLGELAAADKNVTSAVVKVEASMAAHPEQRQVHVDALSAIYVFAARIKRLQGDAEGATTLDRKAAALNTSK